MSDSETEQIQVCPDCEKPAFYSNVATDFEGPEAQAPYWCRNCEAGFDEPDTRERRSHSGRRGLAGKLSDPDTELVTDGGQPEVTGTEIIQYIANREQRSDLREAILHTIDDREADHGAPVGAVIETAVAEHDTAHLMDVCLAVYALARNGEIYAPSETTLRTVDQASFGDDELATDGGPNADEPAENVEHYPDGFHSGDHHLLDGGTPDPDPADPAQWCYECGNERIGACGVCGMPLCGRHLELGAGFCSDRVTVATRVGSVPACIRTLANRRVVVPDAPAFNYERPQRARLPPSELERAVRARLPDALLARAADAVEDALGRMDESNDPAVIETLLSVEKGLAFAQAPAFTGERRDLLIEESAAALGHCLEILDEDATAVAMDLTPAVGSLEQLGVDVDAGDGGDPGEQ